MERKIVVSLDFCDSEHWPEEGMPCQDEEGQLVDDVLSLMMGLQGFLVVGEPAASDQPRKFNVHPSLSPTSRHLLHKILPLATCYSSLARFAEKSTAEEAGRVNQSVGGRLKQILFEFHALLLQMEGQGMGLAGLWAAVEPVARPMSTLAHACDQLARCDCRGGATLGLLREWSYEPLVARLAEAAAVPFMQTLQRWLARGQLFDPMDEFMVSSQNEEFILRPQYTPHFLSVVKERILEAGRFARACPGPEPVISLENAIPAVAAAHSAASATLLSRQMAQLDRLAAIKALFLLERADFLSDLMEYCGPELCKNLADVCGGTLEESVRPLVPWSEVTWELLPKDVWGKDATTGLTAFTLKLQPEWPDTILLGKRACTAYQVLFRVGVSVRLTARTVWRTEAGSRMASGLRHWAGCLLSGLMQSVSLECIAQWERLKLMAARAPAPDLIPSLHHCFLEACLAAWPPTLPILLQACLRLAENLSKPESVLEPLAKEFFAAAAGLCSVKSSHTLTVPFMPDPFYSQVPPIYRDKIN